MALLPAEHQWMVAIMGGDKKDEGAHKLAESDAEELLKEAAEGLRQISEASIPADATTIPGIPLDALRLDAETTQKIDRRAVEDAAATEQSVPASDEDTLIAEADTLSPGDVERPDIPAEAVTTIAPAPKFPDADDAAADAEDADAANDADEENSPTS